MTASTSLFSDITPLSALQLQAEDVFEDLMSKGYEMAADDTVLGRCTGDFTLFIELNPGQGHVLAWLWDASAEEFVGPKYKVHGDIGAATKTACELVEMQLAQESISGGLFRGMQPEVLVVGCDY